MSKEKDNPHMLARESTKPVCLIATSTNTDVSSLLEVCFIRLKLLPTYGPGGDWLCGSGGWYCGGGEFLWSELVVSDEAICGQTEI